MLGGATPDIYSEGLQLPIVKTSSEVSGGTDGRSSRGTCVSRPGDGRLPRAGGVNQDRRAPLPGAARQATARRGPRSIEGTSSRASGWRGGRWRRSRTASMRLSRSWTTTASPRQADPDTRQGNGRRRRMTIDLRDVDGRWATTTRAKRRSFGGQVAFKCVTSPLGADQPRLVPCAGDRAPPVALSAPRSRPPCGCG